MSERLQDLKEYIEQEATLEEEHNQPLDEWSWPKEYGIVLSVNDALWLLQRAERVDDLEADSQAFGRLYELILRTCHIDFLETKHGYIEATMRTEDGVDIRCQSTDFEHLTRRMKHKLTEHDNHHPSEDT